MTYATYKDLVKESPKITVTMGDKSKTQDNDKQLEKKTGSYTFSVNIEIDSLVILFTAIGVTCYLFKDKIFQL